MMARLNVLTIDFSEFPYEPWKEIILIYGQF